MSVGPKIKTIMTIDDSEVDLYLHKRVIKRSGLIENVIVFQFAEDALSYLKSDDSDEVDAILLDINMPRMDGFEFLDRLTTDLALDKCPLVVVMLTTSLDPEDNRRAEQYEVVKGYLNKPLTEEGLQTVAQLVP